nr:MAG TPA: hypothetical protein [Caudoviricetes sp.]
MPPISTLRYTPQLTTVPSSVSSTTQIIRNLLRFKSYHFHRQLLSHHPNSSQNI